MLNRFESDLARRVRRRRKELNLTQREVANEMGVTADCITLVELGYRRLDLDRIPELAIALDMDQEELCRQALRERAPRLYAELFPDPDYIPF